jgi:hypothetical protein
MIQQALLRRRVVSPPLSLTAESNRLSAATPHLWASLPPQTQAQLAQVVAELLRRMLPTQAAPERETSHVDRRKCR